MNSPVRQERLSRNELGRCLIAAGAMSSDWSPAFAGVDRALFLPELMWPFDMGAGTAVPVHRERDPDAWHGYADTDTPIVTQWDDGAHAGEEPGRVATSSASMPSVVFSMLRELDIDHGMRVLDAGTGTGETAALLAHRAGPGYVTTAEVDPGVSRAAAGRLRALGLHADAVVGDALAGHPNDHPYDRLLCTFGVRTIPGAWLRQTRRGGLIVAPWGTHYSNRDAVVRLAVGEDGTASGPFIMGVEFMKARAQRVTVDHGERVPEDWPTVAVHSRSVLPDPDELADAAFVIGLGVPDVVHNAYVQPDGTRAAWFYSLCDASWAAVAWPGGPGPGEVYQHGPRRLWDEVEDAYGWWVREDRPGVDRFGLTITPRSVMPWLDDPDRTAPWRR
ncbi:protein-L-isoaspartate O-methyltransferase family protein [Streptomyces spiramyceticus]|uniref:protein-L-isoaspartate O-methyltransferase family protein n=1 Tax=Streptomyces spiramyceticus TaxID=299717 RepID=UPI00237AF5C1|nr:methyltransferase domain-containing protein [Streptomyces spiramyceticus]